MDTNIDLPIVPLIIGKNCIFIACFTVLYAYFYPQVPRFICISMIRCFLWCWYSNMCIYTILQVMESIRWIKVIPIEEKSRNSCEIAIFYIENLKTWSCPRRKICRSLSYGHVAANQRSIRGPSEDIWQFSHWCLKLSKSSEKPSTKIKGPVHLLLIYTCLWMKISSFYYILGLG